REDVGTRTVLLHGAVDQRRGVEVTQVHLFEEVLIAGRVCDRVRPLEQVPLDTVALDHCPQLAQVDRAGVDDLRTGAVLEGVTPRLLGVLLRRTAVGRVYQLAELTVGCGTRPAGASCTACEHQRRGSSRGDRGKTTHSAGL